MTELTGFTLFKVTGGWQLSTRAKGEVGWSVRIVDERTALGIIGSLPDTGHVPQRRELAPLVRMPVRLADRLRLSTSRVLLDD